MDEASIIFDRPRNLQVTVSHRNETTVVDIIKSLHCDPFNIGHPLIAKAIARYALAVRWASRRSQTLTPEEQKAQADVRKVPSRLSKKQAQTNLDQIFRALVFNPRLSVTETKILAGDALASGYPSEYFETLAGILREPGYFENPMARIENRLKESFPQTDHTYVLSFLKDNAFRLPKRPGGNPGAALRNAFVAWFASSKPQTVKAYRSKRGSMLSQLRPLLSQLPLRAPESVSPQIDEEDARKTIYAIFYPVEVIVPPPTVEDPTSLRMAVRLLETIDLSTLSTEPLIK